jgi:hypothetical protein
MSTAKAAILAALIVTTPVVVERAVAEPAAPAAAVTSAVTPLLVLPNNPTRAVALAIIDGKPYVCHLADITSEQKGGTCVAMAVK